MTATKPAARTIICTRITGPGKLCGDDVVPGGIEVAHEGGMSLIPLCKQHSAEEYAARRKKGIGVKMLVHGTGFTMPNWLAEETPQ